MDWEASPKEQAVRVATAFDGERWFYWWLPFGHTHPGGVLMREDCKHGRGMEYLGTCSDIAMAQHTAANAD
jgi:hypothetical protein